MQRVEKSYRAHVSCLATCASLAGCATPAADEPPDSSSSASEGVAVSSDTSGESEVGLSSDTVEVATPFEDAAEHACAVYHGDQQPVAIPSGEPPYQETGFRLANEFPHRFVVDTNFVPLIDAGVPDGFVCYAVYPGQNDGQDWWFSANDWLDPDGEIRVHMATVGVSDVLYVGGVSDPIITPPIEYDASTLCPELPSVWIPDPAGHPEDANVICVLPTSDEAEFVFVRVP
jgi:hypothetical protein